MNCNRFLDESLANLAKASTHDEMSAIVHAVRDHYEVRSLTYHGLKPHGARKVTLVTVISTTKPEWLQQYAEKELIEIDPIVNTAWQSPLPLDWDAVDRRSRKARFYFSELARFDIGERGLTIPITPLDRPPGILSFTAKGLSTLEWKALRRRCDADMVLFGHHIHFHALRVDHAPAMETVLTERARLCLELVLSGHKPNVIGKMLGLSVHTVRMHLRQAQERLRCHSLAEAVGKAVELGIVRKTAGVVFFALSNALLLVNVLIASSSSLAVI